MSKFYSGVPILSEGECLPWWLPEMYGARIKRVNIPKAVRCHPLRFQALIRANRFLPSGFSRSDYTHRIFHLFDAWAAKQVLKLKPRIVVGYENSSSKTFLAAKSIGAYCVLDASSLHHKSIASLLNFQNTNYLSEIVRRKEAEVESSDLIITCSPWARESFIENGVPADKVRSILLGSELPKGIPAWKKGKGPVRFIFAGGIRHLKSIDIILDAFNRLYEEGFRYSLTFVGGGGDADLLGRIQKTPLASRHKNLPQPALYSRFADSDCLLLPSRFDSFGMVVAEAMACGTPAIVSTNTGSKSIIERFPGSGWIVEPTVDSLYEKLRELLIDPEILYCARARALEASGCFTWQAYRARVRETFKEIFP